MDLERLGIHCAGTRLGGASPVGGRQAAIPRRLRLPAGMTVVLPEAFLVNFPTWPGTSGSETGSPLVTTAKEVGTRNGYGQSWLGFPDRW
jgi:hypothetical protein